MSSAIGYSMIDIDNTDGQSANAFKRGDYALANIMFYPVKNVMFGPEIQWGRTRELPRRLHIRRPAIPVLGEVQLRSHIHVWRRLR